MADIILDVESRDTQNEKNNNLRKNGFIPAIIYGHLKENKTIKLAKSEFLKKLHGNIASNIFIDLNIDQKVSKTVLIKDVQRAAVSRDIEHMDFIEIDPNETLDTLIPVVLVGEALGVTEGDGVLEFLARSIEIECLPKYVPKEIKVDISGLKVGDSIHAGDINLGEQVKLLTPADTIVVMVGSATGATTEETPPSASATPA